MKSITDDGNKLTEYLRSRYIYPGSKINNINVDFDYNDNSCNITFVINGDFDTLFDNYKSIKNLVINSIGNYGLLIDSIEIIQNKIIDFTLSFTLKY